jgi:hypothetical protein
MTSEVMDSSSPISDTARVGMTTQEETSEKERFQSMVRSVAVVLSFGMVRERQHYKRGRDGQG